MLIVIYVDSDLVNDEPEQPPPTYPALEENDGIIINESAVSFDIMDAPTIDGGSAAMSDGFKSDNKV